jgi:hypothetical protein
MRKRGIRSIGVDVGVLSGPVTGKRSVGFEVNEERSLFVRPWWSAANAVSV